MNGGSRRRLRPSAVTCRSSIASSSADWVFGDARLISSARRMLAKSGPGSKRNVSVDRSKMLTPMRSVGNRSGVNCTRCQRQSIDADSALARLVLPTPGTSSTSRWPSARSEMTAISIDDSLPKSTCATLRVTASNRSENVAASDVVGLRPAPGSPARAASSLLVSTLTATRVDALGTPGQSGIPSRR